jgi:Icc-related predicted phosphoesterase
MAESPETIRIAAVGDIHCSKTSQGAFNSLFSAANEAADIFLLCGDLTDYGLSEEAEVLAKEITSFLRIPVVAVLGNHDFETNNQTEVRRILEGAGVSVLDGETCEIKGVGFAGAKGFAGGFGRGALGAWGEASIKSFVQEAIDEALKLETALARLRTEHKIAVLHYSPVQQTVEGEPVEIFAFLGSSRLEEPLNRFQVSAVFHGHAHRGSPEGATSGGTPVYNVAMPLMKTRYPDAPPFRLLELKSEVAVEIAVA